MTQRGVRFLAVGSDGTAYATFDSTGQEQLWASTDSARTWQPSGTSGMGTPFRMMTALSSGTLLADVEQIDETHVLMRSDDRGQSWTPVLQMAAMTSLTPHSFDELDKTIFLAEYQAFTLDSVPVHLWASEDDGRTWSLRQEFDDHRHAHGIRVNPADGSLWIFFGDNDQRTGIFRSTDAGRSFSPLLSGLDGSAVDVVFTSAGAIFGNDIVFGSTPPKISVLKGKTLNRTFRLPGPSYSIHETPVGGLVVGTTREPLGDVYDSNDDAGHLLASADGQTWDDVLQFPRVDETHYGRVNVYWTLPSGELVVQLSDVEPVGYGYGYQLVKAEVSP